MTDGKGITAVIPFFIIKEGKEDYSTNSIDKY